MKTSVLRAEMMIGLVLLVMTSACGVKSRPLPPLSAPQIGRGEPSLVGTQNEAQQNLKQKKKTSMDDFEDEADF